MDRLNGTEINSTGIKSNWIILTDPLVLLGQFGKVVLQVSGETFDGLKEGKGVSGR